ncbi:MAG: RsmD family RNA methyltransferase [Patescibacteria group bacterium]|nr:RsmD family RNA methyltransferase [Patescibacteria group bacterium]
MHIGTGQFEGKKLKDSHDGAPLSTRILTMKESIFEIIGVRIHESAVLDINDQNGMYGIEAVSKGAAVVQFINLHKEERSLVSDNLKIVGLDPNEFVIDKEPEDFFKKGTDARFDIIFFRAVDKHCLSMLERVLALQNESGITVVFHPQDNDCELREAPEGYQIIDTRDVETDRVTVMLRQK